ncbi:hypothetical protein E2C01_044924 [Portunus trituberculatus]|uniref:Chitin-binding type-2 domain-containing protein n=1 Tax=Portunus trituberculatus TaxID=210409 RepID=A0A5B7FZN7_PORTR|nr:hypothetical protein [Portunus trituberculatus]
MPATHIKPKRICELVSLFKVGIQRQVTRFKATAMKAILNTPAHCCPIHALNALPPTRPILLVARTSKDCVSRLYFSYRAEVEYIVGRRELGRRLRSDRTAMFPQDLCNVPATWLPVFFEVPEHCSQYCECSNGIAWLFECARGTLWDTWIEECIAEYLVDCGSRPKP